MSVACPSVPRMIIDCGTCTVRGDACRDCVVTFLTIPVRDPAARCAAPDGAAGTSSGAGAPVELDDAERGAIAVLSASGLVPPLRLRAG